VSGASAGDIAEGTAVVANPHGIHARPSHMLVTAATAFSSRVELEWDGRKADARSILSVMTLGAPAGARVTVRAQGPDAARAVAALLAILESAEPA
jgi:phosphotransferase system HPr (HPr) family protein